jgi:N-acyl-D-amino-acid deacylase
VAEPIYDTHHDDHYDLVIDDATIYDGSGKPPYTGSVGVKNNLIATIAPTLSAHQAKTRISGKGLCLMPGIIDSHTHYDAQITWDPYLAQSVQMGVTTALIGNCGFTISPCLPQNRDLVMKNLTQVEGMSLDSLKAGIDWGFETFPEYMDLIERKGCAMNLAAFVGHSTLRTHVMGSQASDRIATTDEIQAMRTMLDEALACGAIGLATTTSTSHSAYDGRPMPSRLADQAEFDVLLDGLRISKRGSLMLTKGPATPTPTLMQWAKRCERPFLVAALLHSSLMPNGVFDDLDLIAGANADGLTVKGAVATTPLSFDFTFDTPYPLEPLKGWKPYFGAKGNRLKEALQSKAVRDDIRAELATQARRLFSGDWSLVHLLQTELPAYQKFEHQSIDEIAKALNKDPLDTMFDLALEDDLKTLFSLVSLNHDELAVERLLTHEHSLVSLSDAGAHLSFLDESGFGLVLLGYWCRDKKIMSIEQAVHRLTKAQADFFQIPKRGELKVGYHADMLLFDLKSVGRGNKQRLHDLPANATRVATESRGVIGVWVNGVQVANESGALNSAIPGKLLRDCAMVAQ